MTLLMTLLCKSFSAHVKKAFSLILRGNVLTHAR